MWIMLVIARLCISRVIDFYALESQDPAQTFEQLQASGDATAVGEETIDGAVTTHYRGRIDVSKIPQGEKIQKLTKVKYGPYDAWVGKDDGYVRRLRTSYSYATGGVRQHAVVTMSFSDFGKTVNVDVPSDADSSEAPDNATQGLGG